MSRNNYQLVALPLKPHLVEFLCSKIKTPYCILESGSIATTLPISKRSFFGELIYTGLKPSKSFNKAQSNFYIAISDHAYRYKKSLPDTRNNIVKLPPENINLIEKLLREFLEVELVSYVNGAIFSNYKIKGTKKGIQHKAIEEFMFQNIITINESTFEMLRKIYDRANKTPKPLKLLQVTEHLR
ncbi:hypothetical protein [Lacinutrix sp. Hel_I_90]|uniref:hypothetical protein n=1 Tax=Lacinutrix sp. Hel_I_90 TaxID=1249999 RepID=UPI0012E03B4A|nr:hypothetical protein [Lacinutrix sp. Hel_I_90]